MKTHITPLARRLLAAALLFSAVSASAADAPRKKVVITSAGIGRSTLMEKDLAEFRAAAPSLTIVMPPRDGLAAEIADADAVIGTLTQEQVRTAPKLKWVQISSAGAERMLFPEFKERKIALTNTRIIQGPEIADHAFALLLSLTRGINLAVAGRPTAAWNPRDYRPLELSGKTAVIVGVGGIGTQIAVRAKAFGMRVIGVDLHDLPLVPFLDQAVRSDRLDAVLPQADVLFISAPHTPRTEKMIRARQFALMKPDAFFICVSRGKIYDADALVDSLKSKHLLGAGLDVTDPEPLPAGHALWKFDNVVITPHIAGRSDGEGPRYVALYKENLIRFANGEPLLHTVDQDEGF